MDKWCRQPLAVVTSLPLILAALRWDWLAMLRLSGQTPAKLTLDSEIFWLFLGAVCFVLNVFNLLVIYRQEGAVVQTTQYKAASWLLSILIMVGLVVCWSRPGDLLFPTRITWLLVVATVIVAAQALVGNYFVLATATPAKQQPSLTLSTATWLVAAVLGWPVFPSGLCLVAAAAVVVGLGGFHLPNLPCLLKTACRPVDQLAAGVVIASELSVIVYGLIGCWQLWQTSVASLFSVVSLADLLLLAAGSQWVAIISRQLVNGKSNSVMPRWLLTGAVLVVGTELAVVGLLFFI